MKPATGRAEVPRIAPFLALGATYLLLSAYFLGGTDDHIRAHLSLTRALAEQGTVVADRYLGESHDLAFYASHYYIAKPPGLAVIAAPVWWTLGMLGADFNTRWRVVTPLLSSLPAAVAGVLLLVLALRIGAPWWMALLTSFAGFFGTGFWSYSTLFLETPLVVFCLLGTLILVTGSRFTTIHAAGAGFLLGCAVLLQYLVAFATLPVLAMIILRTRRVKPLVIAGLLMAVPVSVIPLYNFLCFGNPFQFGHFTSAVPQFQKNHETLLARPFIPRLDALWGLLLSMRKSLLIWSPPSTIALVGLGLLIAHSDRRRLAATVGLMFLITFLLNSSLPNWDGGMLSGPRYLVPLLMVMMIGLTGFAVTPNIILRTGGYIATGLSMTVSLLLWTMLTIVTPFSEEWRTNPIVEQHIPDLFGGNHRPNLGTLVFKLGAGSSLVVLMVVGLAALAGSVWLFWLTQPQNHCRPSSRS